MTNIKLAYTFDKENKYFPIPTTFYFYVFNSHNIYFYIGNITKYIIILSFQIFCDTQFSTCIVTSISMEQNPCLEDESHETRQPL
jgi:hypothetical protein